MDEKSVPLLINLDIILKPNLKANTEMFLLTYIVDGSWSQINKK